MEGKDVMIMNITNSAAYGDHSIRAGKDGTKKAASMKVTSKQSSSLEQLWYDISKNSAQDAKNVEDQQGAAAKKAESSVSVELSEKGLQMAKLADAFRKQNMKRLSNAGKKKKKPTGDLSRALAIARRIMKGEKVPPKDESFLFHYNSDLYLKAKMMATIQENPKKHKSLLEELEEENGNENADPGSAPSAPDPETPESPGDSDDGGEASS